MPSIRTTPSDDEELVAAFLAGRPDATETVRSWIRAASIPHRRRQRSELEDIEQEVLVDLLENLRNGRFEGRSTLSTYVRRMMHYKCLNRAREQRSRVLVGLEEHDVRDDRRPPPDPERRSGGRDLVLRVLAAVPEDCRRLWSMIHEGRSYREMAEREGVAPGTLRVRVLRCRRRADEERQRLEALEPSAVDGLGGHARATGAGSREETDDGR